MAERLNAEFASRFRCHGPFFSYSESPSPEPHKQGGFGYYRLTEQFFPQAKSPWYVGSGAQVGLSTLTGLAMLASFLGRRDPSKSVIIWPHEAEHLSEARHVIVEAYPILMGAKKKKNQDAEDARAICDWLKTADQDSRLAAHLDLVSVAERWGQEKSTFFKRVAQEGWIVGV